MRRSPHSAARYICCALLRELATAHTDGQREMRVARKGESGQSAQTAHETCDHHVFAAGVPGRQTTECFRSIFRLSEASSVFPIFVRVNSLTLQCLAVN